MIPTHISTNIMGAFQNIAICDTILFKFTKTYFWAGKLNFVDFCTFYIS